MLSPRVPVKHFLSALFENFSGTWATLNWRGSRHVAFAHLLPVELFTFECNQDEGCCQMQRAALSSQQHKLRFQALKN